MAFHEIQFPTTVSQGSRFGLGFNTSLIEGDDGSTVAVSRWPNGRASYNARFGITHQTLATEVLVFYRARQGIVHGFRWKDWFDFTSASDHIGTPANTDQNIGTGSGAGAQLFQLQKVYADAINPITRAISKPVTGSVVVAVDEVDQAGNFTVNTTTGVVTLTPSGDITGDPVTAGFEFDVPVRFAEEIDESLLATGTEFETASIPNVPIVEILGDLTTPHPFYHGGGSTVNYTGNQFHISWDMGLAIRFAGTVATTVLMPDPASLEPGGLYFHLFNDGSATLSFRTFDDTSALFSLPTNSGAITWVSNNSGTNDWRGI